MKEGGYAVAVVGAAGLVGRELRRVLEDRVFPVAELRLFESVDGLGEEDGGDFEVLDERRIANLDFVFLCATDTISAQWNSRAAGATVIDVTQVFDEQDDVPVVVPEVNGRILDASARGGIVACPVPGAVALAVVLKPLADIAGLENVVVTTLEPAASAGRAGIDVLSRQSRDLLSGCSVETEPFPHRGAFNLVPQSGVFLDSGASRGEAQIGSQLRRLLDAPELPVAVTCVQAPTFFGCGYSVHVETASTVEPDEARRVLRHAPGVLLIDDPSEHAYPTLVDAVEHDAACVGRIRGEQTNPCGLDLWVTLDGTRKGAAVNAVQIAEILAREEI